MYTDGVWSHHYSYLIGNVYAMKWEKMLKVLEISQQHTAPLVTLTVVGEKNKTKKSNKNKQ